MLMVTHSYVHYQGITSNTHRSVIIWRYRATTGAIMQQPNATDLRVVTLETEEELAKFIDLIESHVTSNDLEELESWLDSEFHRIYVTYAYPDVTKVN